MLRSTMTVLLLGAYWLLPAQNDLQADITHVTNANREISFSSNYKTLLPQLRRLSATNKKVQQPFIKHFWEFDDGTFSTKPEEKRATTSAEDRNVHLFLTPCYTLDKIKPITKTIRRNTSLASTKDPLNENYAGSLRLSSNLSLHGIDAVRANDQFVSVISYRNLTGSERNATLYLFYNKKKQVQSGRQVLNVMNTRLHGATEGSMGNESGELKGYFSEYYSSKVFKINKLNKISRNLFLTFLVDGKAGFENLKELDILAVMVLEGTNQLEKSLLTFQTASSFDPNNIKAPRVLSFRGINNKTFKYRINFENVGNSPAQSVTVNATIPEALNVNSVRNIKTSHAVKNNTTKDSAISYQVGPDGKGITFMFKDILINGIQEEWNPRKKDTRGYIEYELEARKDMRKLPLKTSASIVFDNNEPIVTDPVKTVFKTGISLGIKAGVNYQPNTEGYSYFLGATYSAYRPARFYNQIELMADVNRRSLTRDSLTFSFPNMRLDTFERMAGYARKDSFSFRENYKSVTSFRVVPLHIRYDLPKFLSFGIGVYGDIGLVKEQTFTTASMTKYHVRYVEFGAFTTPENCTLERKMISNKTSTEINYGLLGDIAFGNYSHGLSLGLRFMLPLTKEKLATVNGIPTTDITISSKTPNFFQAYLSYKIF